jgi:Erythromycin esterase homolog
MKTFNRILIVICIFSVIYLGILFTVMSGAIGGTERKLDDIEQYGQTLDELVIPEGTKVVGIGEASHGNCEFQTAKLDMLKKQVEAGVCHSIAFEMNPGESAEINDAIHGGDVDIEELMGRTDYPLYDTAQMIELVEWMRDYNKDKSLEDSVTIYGVDIQGPWRDMNYLADFGERHPDTFTEEEMAKFNTMIEDDDYDIYTEKDFFTGIYNKLLAYDEYEYKYAALVAEILLQSYDAPSFTDTPDEYAAYRDSHMAQNLMSFYNLEVERGYSQIIITAHNGHTMKGEQEGYGEVSAMGGCINDIFEGSYFSVGTAYYNACVNIHVAGTYDDNYVRKDYNFCSDDILAYQAKYFEGEKYCLNFSEITDTNCEVYKKIHNPGFMGLVGEGISALTEQQRMDRARLVQADRFDAVIYYYNVTPIRCLNY